MTYSRVTQTDLEMAEERYNLVFKGETVKGVALEQAKVNLGKLFKVSGVKLDALFSGKSIVLKRNLEFDTASTYRVAIKKAGCRVDVIEVQGAVTQPPVAQPRSSGKAVFGASDPSYMQTESEIATHDKANQSGDLQDQQPAEPVVEEIVAGLPASEKPVTPEVLPDVSEMDEFGLAPVGADILTPQERQVPPLPVIEVANISIQDLGEDLLSENEKSKFVPADIDVSELDIAPVGADVLTPDERQDDVVVDMELSSYSIAEVGTMLGSPKPAPPPPPDVSNISLEKSS